ncbi:hypothetical protein [Streptomyces sp. DSM 15324]|uniref:hypothetical protein n=1 Tax=Streptomyces sp. DSM 15324 TaxID=1739111 RepID=UPI000B04292D|nr:hypothetical protein [Streptomyces sp. DSM 15324]
MSLTEHLRNDPNCRVHDLPVGHHIARRDPHGLAAVFRLTAVRLVMSRHTWPGATRPAEALA